MREQDRPLERPPESTTRTVRREEPQTVWAPEHVEYAEHVPPARELVRWGPILAGFFTALTTTIFLSLLGVAIGLSAVGAQAGGAAAQDIGMPSAIWGAITGIIAFFLGGFVSGRTANVYGRNRGAWNGALVFLATVPVVLWLAAQGVGVALSTLGEAAATIIPQMQGQVPPGTAPNLDQARNAAWASVFALLVGVIASTLGGALGARTHDPEHGPTNGHRA